MASKKLTLGSLFDGSGGFPFGGLLAGIEPIWASEIEPFPVRVTTKRLPQIKHYGDISTLSGAKIEPVDIITFGSPCQDMSIAGKRAGLEGSKSNLFYQAIRIIKEMRCATDGKYPRYIVWENVPGAFSSNKGEDFKAVLDEICRVKDSQADTPRPKKWPGAGCIMADDYSVAWRVFDAQYWGVPQRRKRIYLVADFGGQCAGKILFKSEGVSGYTPQGFRAWQGVAGGAEEGAGETGRRSDAGSGTLCVNCGMSTGRNGVLQAAGFSTEPSAKARSIGYEEEVSPTLRAGVVPAALRVFSNHGQSCRYNGPVDVAPTVTSTYGTGGNNQPFMVAKGPGAVAHPVYTTSKNSYHTEVEEDVANTLVATDYKDPPTVSEEPYYIVRRLTPTECARLQGFPDWWCDGLGTDDPTDEEVAFWREVFETHRKVMGTSSRPKTDAQIIKWLKHPHSDSAEYKMWGNGVALPCVYYVLSGIVYYSAEKGKQNPQI